MFTGRQKWWIVEARFARPLTVREARRIAKRLPLRPDDAAAVLGQDGLHTDQWPEKWPTPDDGRMTLHALRSVGVPLRWRAAPYGRDCDTGCDMADERFGEMGLCARASNAGSCAPVWTAEDWTEVTP